ncbi:hypothetical protein FHR25_002328 [Yokenella regensburgei]|nr:hypothetical protein FHR25_002328 [Yokenella regensburgei]
MKKALIMVSMACMLAGCDNATAPASFTPEIEPGSGAAKVKFLSNGNEIA